MNVTLTSTQILGGLVVVLVLLWAWRASARRARAAVDAGLGLVHGCCR